MLFCVGNLNREFACLHVPKHGVGMPPRQNAYSLTKRYFLVYTNYGVYANHDWQRFSAGCLFS